MGKFYRVVVSLWRESTISFFFALGVVWVISRDIIAEELCIRKRMQFRKRQNNRKKNSTIFPQKHHERNSIED